MKNNLYDAGFAGRLKLKVEAIPTLKGHKSDPQWVSETVSNVVEMLCLHLSSNIIDSLSERQLRKLIYVNKFIHETTEPIHLSETIA